MLSQRSLEVFREVMLYGSLVGAAQLLHISQPAVSRHISDLETQTGLTLFRRTGNRATPTKEAFALLAEVDRSFIGLREIEAHVARIAGGEMESITLAAMPVIATTMLPEVVAALHMDFPNTNVELHSAHSTHIIPRVRGGSFALGIVSLRQPTVGVRVMWRDSFPYYCLLPQNDPLSERDIIRPADLAGRAFIGYAETAMSGIMLDRVLAGVTPAPIMRMRVHLSKSTWALVENGCGIAIVDAFAAHAHRSRGGVVRRFETDTRLDLALIVWDGATRDPYVDLFVEGLKEVSNRYKSDEFL